MDALEQQLCAAFCGGIQVHPVPSGYAISTAFEEAGGDRITFYVVEAEEGFRLEDDGDYLATLVARDIQFEDGARGNLLNAILAEGNAFWDRDTFEIKSSIIQKEDLARQAIAFLSALIRVRDLGLLTRERIRSAFRDDVLSALSSTFSSSLRIEENVAPRADLKDFPADIVLRPLGPGRTASIYLASSSDKLNEALLAWLEFAERDPQITVVALMEDIEFRNISRFKFQRAQNRGVPMATFRGDEAGAMERIAKQMGITVQ